ncbi:hypothetical protein AB0D10_39365 [Kitasatospora sp. NPDC048545]|uniref:DUF7919 family protein n=1 Tax=Kitasatospora sp. NPDC048545 TaxID=3157208 RepID=UPI0033D14ACB
MAEFADLSEFTYSRKPIPMQSVGWLGRQLGVQGGAGVVDNSLLLILADQAKTPRSRTMGVHVCELCPGNEAERADGEIHVYAEDGSSYSAPTMIVHYVEAHGYVPPEEFLRALGRSGPLAKDSRMLALINEIRDNGARIGSQRNAVLDIPEWGDDPRSVAALFEADADRGFSELAGRAVGESFARIMMARGELDGAGYARLTPHARWGVIGRLRELGSPLAEGLEEPPAEFDYFI